jgi:N-acetylglucosaminyldiphosphoundecaprenol N-acetyl-beta-D-mannosaminyltransferase
MPPPNAPPSLSNPPRQRLPVLGVPIDVLPATRAAGRIVDWAAEHDSRVVCLCNVHSVVSAGSDARLRQALERADLALPDGAPVAWMLRREGAAGQARVPGPDLMVDTLALAAERGVSVFLYGGRTDTLQQLQLALQQRWPALRVAGAISPPFRPPVAAEIAADVEAINRSGAGIVWVGLGCPKQERWMAERHGQVQAVMVGVGAAFDFLAGQTPRAPSWMRRHGLEWLHRLATEPRRLAGRYLSTNPRFVLGALRQLLRRRGAP